MVKDTDGSRDLSQTGQAPMRPAAAAPSAVQPPPHLPESALMDDTSTVEISLRLGEPSPFGTISNRPARALLLRMDGVHAGSVFTVEQLPCTIGRHATNTLHIDEESISRFHARICREEQGFFLEDLQSRNGTSVAGKRITRHPLKDGDGLTFGAQVAFRFSVADSHAERLLRRLYESSTRDALTGAYNRAHFDERLRAEIAFASRHAAEMSLVMIDIDHFKRVNDTFGHQAGDVVLKELVKLSQKTLRTEDVFARFGGEEFAVILRGTNLDGAFKLAERLRVALKQSLVQYEGRIITATLSAGCASLLCCESPASPSDFIRIADRRLYLAKTGGRNRVVIEG